MNPKQPLVPYPATRRTGAPMTHTTQLAVTIEHDTVSISDPLLPKVPATTIVLQRTLRIPDDGREWPLPPGLGNFPLRTVESLGDKAPIGMRQRGGIVVPIYQAEALWLSFNAPHWRPMAIKVGAGMVNAVNADPLDGQLRPGREDYLVTPPQPWLDGFKTGEGTISQFVAMPLGSDTTVEGQLTGAETIGGLQLVMAGPKPGRFPEEPPHREHHALRRASMTLSEEMPSFLMMPAAAPAMGLAAGGRMTQKLYPDPHGAATWDVTRAARIWIHLVPAPFWTALTGEPRPKTPASHDQYVRHGLPWFAVYDEPLGDMPVDPRWSAVKTVQALTDNFRTVTQKVGTTSW